MCSNFRLRLLARLFAILDRPVTGPLEAGSAGTELSLLAAALFGKQRTGEKVLQNTSSTISSRIDSTFSTFFEVKELKSKFFHFSFNRKIRFELWIA